jgi:serine/threonine protein kinase
VIEDQFIGKYRIDERLGSGTFATVYRCYDPDLDSTCAIKVLAENWSDDERARSWFLNEARVMFGIEHPSILRIFTSGSLDDGRPYFVMEYADQGSLADRIRQNRSNSERFSVHDALDISIAIADGLIVAHGRGLVHRDLKPSNVLFRSAPDNPGDLSDANLRTSSVKIADFGLARGLEQGANSLAGAGTPHYIAPEQARGLADDRPDVRSDIYSAATILYEMLAGRVPFPYQSMTQVIAAHLNEEPPPVQEFAPALPDEVAELIHKGLEKEPADRFADATAWKQHLQVLRTVLNPDGSMPGWDAPPSVVLPPRIDRPDPAPHDQVEDEARTVEISSLTATRVHPGFASSTEIEGPPIPARQPERSSRMGAYVVAAVAIGFLVVGFLGFALSDLVSSNENETGGSSELAVGGDDEATPTAEAEVTATPEATPEPTPSPDPTATAAATPSPSPTPEATPEQEPDPAVADITEVLEALPGSASSVVILPSGEEVERNSEAQVPAAGTITLWIAAATLDEIADENLDLDDIHVISESDQASGTGILNSQQYIGQPVSIAQLLETMVIYSDNTAANILLDLVGGFDRVNQFADDNGFGETRMQRRLGSLDPDNENYTSARDGARFISRLLNDEIVDEDSSAYILALLHERSTPSADAPDAFGHELAEGVFYAHMAGLLPGVRNEFGYYFNESLDEYVVVSFMLRDLTNEAAGEQAIADAVGEIDSLLNR